MAFIPERHWDHRLSCYPQAISRLAFHDGLFRPRKDKYAMYGSYLVPNINELQAELDFWKKYLEDTRKRVQHYTPHVHIPFPLLDTILTLLKYFHQDVFRARDWCEIIVGLGRAIRELHGYYHWYAVIDRWAGQPHGTLHYFQGFFRGAIANNSEDIDLLTSLHLPAYRLYSCKHYQPGPSNYYIRFDPISNYAYGTPIDFVEAIPGHSRDNTSSNEYWNRIFHNKDMFLYPAVVEDHSTFERACRGLAPRLDQFNKDRRGPKHSEVVLKRMKGIYRLISAIHFINL